MGRDNAQTRRQGREKAATKKKAKEKKAKGKEAAKAAKAAAVDKSVDELLAEIEAEAAAKLPKYADEACLPPSPRAHCSLSAHPTKNELFMFGGEHNDGRRTKVFSELFIYKIKQRQWRKVTLPVAPNPRSAHQAVVVPGSDASLFIFGGEFTSPNGSQFYHYSDLWRLPLKQDEFAKGWTKVEVKGGPSARSGHRMALYDNKLVVFGGFQDNNRSTPRYFGDVHIFDLSTYNWTRLQFPPLVQVPDPRSAAQLCVTPAGLLVTGGYSISRVKGDVFKGKPHEDCWLLEAEPLPEEAEGGGAAAASGGKKKKVPGKVVAGNSSWKWDKQKPTGDVPEAATGVAIVSARDKAYAFGGVIDEEEEDAIKSSFQQNFLLLKLGGEKLTYHDILIESEIVDAAAASKSGGGADEDEPAARKGKRKGQQLPDMLPPGLGPPSDGEADEGAAAAAGSSGGGGGDAATAGGGAAAPAAAASKFYEARRPSMPSPRISSQLAISGSELFMYGGTVEVGVRQITLSDLHSIDLKKTNQWLLHHGNDKTTEEWLEEESSSDESGSDSEDDEEEEAPKKGKGKKKGPNPLKAKLLKP